MAIGAALPETSLALDNDVFTHWRRNRQMSVLHEIGEYIRRFKQPPALTSTTIFEARWGLESEVVKGRIAEVQAQQYRLRIEELSQACPVLPFDQQSAVIAAYVFSRLSHSQCNKHWRDVFIAATALSHGHGVATGNKTDFELISNCLPPNHQLRLAIWKP